MRWLLIWVLAGLGQTVPFQLVTTHLPPPQPGQPYAAFLTAEGGQPPYTWILKDTLPVGLQFDPRQAEILGQPSSSEPFAVLVEVWDSSVPSLEETRLLPTGNGAPLELSWTAVPMLDGDRVQGALEVENGSREAVLLTVFAVAVNEVGKAFSLRYARLPLTPGQATPPLDFNVMLPPGQYTLHVDAVGENKASGAIYRGRMQRPGISVPPGP